MKEQLEPQIEQYAKRVKELHELCRGNEAQTKASLIAPLFGILGFDMADPRECEPGYRADCGKGEKTATPVDWAFRLESHLIFVVEAKEAGKELTTYAEQLGMYFVKAAVQLGIFTNGVQWKFYTDLDKLNIMDHEPFLTWNILNDDPLPLDFLTILHKSQFQTQLIRTFAERGRKQSLLVDELARLLEPSPDFIKFAVERFETRNLVVSVVEEWKPILENAIYEWARQRSLMGVLGAGSPIPTSHDNDDDQSIPFGTTLTRQYKGRTYQVKRVAEGFEYEGTVYKYLTAVAKVITGYPAISGPGFFRESLKQLGCSRDLGKKAD